MSYSLLLLSALAYHAGAQGLPLYINAGTSSYVDSSGSSWVPDDNFISTGRHYTSRNRIATTIDDKIYQEERWFSQSTSTYSIPIPSGITSVEVVLHFAEIFFSAENKRVFDVEINGELVKDGLDIVKAAGGNNRPLTVAHVVNTNCGQPSCSLDISLIRVKENPKISGIVVLPLTAQSQTDAPTRSPSAFAVTEAPTEATTSAPSGIAALRLIHAPTNVELLDLVDGMIIDTEALGVTPEFNVQAVKSDNSVERVQFLENGRSEGVEPFAFCGDSSGNYNVCESLGLGSNTVTAIPYSGGQALPGMSVSFDVVGPTEPPTPSPVPLDPNGPRWIEVDWVEDVEDDDDEGIEARHEACFVMVGRKGYLVGGRGNKDTGIYDPVSRTWTKGARPPIQMHHMQCVAAQGKLWVMAAWTDWYPRESNAEHGYVYDPATDTWSTRTAMPEARRRGGAAAIVSDDETKIYISHGNDGGHETSSNRAATSLGYLDVYDIATDSWTALSDDAPNPRGKEHMHFLSSMF